MKRCLWPETDLEIKYHDQEWGVPCHDDQKLFEYILLDTFQAGLSWSLMLEKRDNFRKVFYNFNYNQVAKMTDAELEQALENSGIVRNRLKVYSTRNNAKKFKDIRREFGSFDDYIWQFTNHKTIDNDHSDPSNIPTKTPESEAMSKDLKKHGFKFVGPTICYALMQGIGMVNDHLTSCFRYEEVKQIAKERN